MSISRPMVIFCCIALATGLLASKAFVSIAPLCIVFFAITDIQFQPFRVRWLLTWANIKSSIRDRPVMWIYPLFFLLYLLGILYPGPLKEWWAMTHPKSAFLVFGVAFAMLPYITRREYMLISVCMIVLVVWSSIWVQAAYYQDMELFYRSLGYGASLPTPGSHIRYSSIVAISMILCAGFAIENWVLKYKWERILYAIIAIYLFYFLHVLSVRSGLVQAYFGVVILGLLSLRKLSMLKKVLIVLALCLAPVIAYNISPSFQYKIHYALYDIRQFQKGEGDPYSDSQRWESWKAGLALGNASPIFGPGPAQFKSELRTYYTDTGKSFEWRPLNQWIHIFSVFGIVGLAVLLFVLIFPVTRSFFWIMPAIPTIYFMQILIMMVEHPLDTLVGTAMFLLFSLMGFSYQKGEEEAKEKAEAEAEAEAEEYL